MSSVATPAGRARAARTTAVTCAECGTRVTGPFCYHCGAETGRVACPRCHGATRPDSRFCTSCGERVGARWHLPGWSQFFRWALGIALVRVVLLVAWPSVSPSTSVAPQGLEVRKLADSSAS